MVPRDAPKRNRKDPSIKGVSAIVKVGRKMIRPKPPNNTIDLGPWRAATNPVSGIAIIEPSPKQSNRRPNWVSSAPTLSFINGKSGAQQAITNPAVKNVSRVANRAGAVAENVATINPIFDQN
jgi:hypothetical protein|tara:strand:- start:3863 stop:4231 length:369 start_codon:yes stop_codon:yes gene_type:complete